MTSTAELSSPSSANTDLTKGVVDADYTLEDKYTPHRGAHLPERRAGAGALPLMQKLRDRPPG
jgi:indolepyruvate ferredoxin oxidoreductase